MRRRAGSYAESLKLGEHEVLKHAGTITAEAARQKAETEYEAYRRHLDQLPASVERNMTKALEAAVERVSKPRRKRR